MKKSYKVEKDFVIDGYRCLVIGQSLGHRCGYVGVPLGHPIYGKHYDDIDVNVHGGLTYSAGDNKLLYPSGDKGLWWIGFDCAHYGDGKDFDLIRELSTEDEYEYYMNTNRRLRLFKDGEIRTREYVEEQLISLVSQLKNI